MLVLHWTLDFCPDAIFHIFLGHKLPNLIDMPIFSNEHGPLNSYHASHSILVLEATN